MKKLFTVLFLTSLVLTGKTQKNKILTLRLERIDPATGRKQIDIEKVPGNEVGIIVMDMWDKHWCKSWTARDGAMAPGMNKLLSAARKMGVQVIFSPSGVVDFYKDYPQRKAVLNMPAFTGYLYPSVYQLRDSVKLHAWNFRRYAGKYFPGTIYGARDTVNFIYTGFPPLPPFALTGGCECRDRSCGEGSVWTRQNKDLIIGTDDLIADGDSNTETYNICKDKGITHLLYIGGAGNMCLTWTRGNSTISMLNRGIKCAYISDLIISISGNGYNPDNGKSDPDFTPSTGDRLVLDHLRKYVAPTVKSYEVFAISK